MTKKTVKDNPVAEESNDEDEVITKSVIHPKIKKAYGKTQSCGDSLSVNMKKSLSKGETLEQIASRHDLDMKRWDHLNYGMQRMNLGNAIRWAIKRGEIVDYVV